MKTKTLLPAAFLSPALIILAVLALVPTVYAIVISFEDRELSPPQRFSPAWGQARAPATAARAARA